jgi:hypothetical protein
LSRVCHAAAHADFVMDRIGSDRYMKAKPDYVIDRNSHDSIFPPERVFCESPSKGTSGD